MNLQDSPHTCSSGVPVLFCVNETEKRSCKDYCLSPSVGLYGFHVSVGEGMRADESRLKGPDLHVVQPRVMVDDIAFAG